MDGRFGFSPNYRTASIASIQFTKRKTATTHKRIVAAVFRNKYHKLPVLAGSVTVIVSAVLLTCASMVLCGLLRVPQ